MKKIEMEKLEKALLYVERIAEGNNPIGNEPAPYDAVLNNPDIIRSMFFAKEVLSELKQNGGVIGKTYSSSKKKDFPIETLAAFQFAERKTITRLTEQLNSGINTDEYQKIKYKTITDWLKENGYLQEKEDEQLGKKVTLATTKGQAIGIRHSLQTGMNGSSYYRVEYNKSAQEFVVQNLPEMLGVEMSA